jgi:DNA recombination protein RmuC
LAVSQREHGASRERLAVAEERTQGLAKMLADEKASGDAERRALSAELDAAMDTRDRVQSTLANTSQQLAAANERVAGFQRNVAAEREGSDAARRSLSAELDSITAVRDRLQASLTDASQRLAAAEERVLGLTRSLAAERESNDLARRALSSELDAAVEARDRLHVSLAEASQKLVGAQQMEQELRGRISRAESQVANWDEKGAAFEEQLEALRVQLEAKERDLAASLEREFTLVRDLAEKDKKQLEGLREKLAAEFETIANRLLAGSANQQPARAQDVSSSVLDPLSARIVDFQQKVQTARLEARQSETARAVAEQAGALYETLVAAVCELNEVSSKLRAAGEAHDQAISKLTTGTGNVLTRAEQLKSLGGAGAEARVGPLKSAAEK